MTGLSYMINCETHVYLHDMYVLIDLYDHAELYYQIMIQDNQDNKWCNINQSGQSIYYSAIHGIHMNDIQQESKQPEQHCDTMMFHDTTLQIQ
jgi:hypothetical protein